MKIITKEVKVYNLSFRIFFSKAKKLVKKIGSILKKAVNKAVAYIVEKIPKAKETAIKTGGKIKAGIDIAVEYIHAKIDQFELWLYLKLEKKFADFEAGLEILEDELEDE